jgi:hypothetical protein
MLPPAVEGARFLDTHAKIVVLKSHVQAVIVDEAAVVRVDISTWPLADVPGACLLPW